VERMHGWVGRQDRFPVEVEAVVHRADGTDLSVVVSNISDEGCRLEGAEIFTIGERLTIAIPRIGTVRAQVRWALAGSAGAKFIDDSEF
jgi:PilZ domain-containing protein